MERHIRAVDQPAAWPKRYLGDGVYAAFDGLGVWLTAENGAEATDSIYLESEVLIELRRFVDDAQRGRG